MRKKFFLVERGMAQLVVMVVMLVLAVSLPIALKLVQQKQDSRSSAAGTTLTTIGSVWVGWSPTWLGGVCTSTSQCAYSSSSINCGDGYDSTGTPSKEQKKCYVRGSDKGCTDLAPGASCSASTHTTGETCTTSGGIGGVAIMGLCQGSGTGGRCCVPKCDLNKTRCEGGYLYTCYSENNLVSDKGLGYLWLKATSPCSSGKCNSDGTTCADPLCTESNWSCTTTPSECPSSGQQTKTCTKVGTCTGGVSDPSGNVPCTPACTDGCSGTTLTKCNNGVGETSTCTGSTPICSTTVTGGPKCVECETGAVSRCSNDGLGRIICNSNGNWESNVVSGAECGDGKVCEGAGANAECKDVTFCDTEGKTSNCIGWLEDGDGLGVQKCTSISYGTGTTLAWVGIGCTGGNTCKKYNDVFQCMGAIPTLPALDTYPNDKISFNILYTLDGVTAGNASCVTNSWQIKVRLTRVDSTRDDEESGVGTYNVVGNEVLNEDGTPQTNDEGEIIYKAPITLERGTLQDVSFGQRFFIWIDGPKGLPTKYAFSGQTEAWPLKKDEVSGLGGKTSSFVLEETESGIYKLYDLNIGSNSSVNEPINLKTFSVLAGDTNDDRVVNGTDYQAIKSYLTYAANKGDSLRIIDMDGNCLVNSGDLAAFQRAYTSLYSQNY